MKSIDGKHATEAEQKFWTSIKGLVFSDTTGVAVMGVAVVIALIVNFF